MVSSHFLVDIFLNDFLYPLIHRAEVFIMPAEGLFVGYLFSAICIAVIYYSVKLKTWNCLYSFKELLRVHNIKSKSVKDDIKLYIFDKIILGFIYSFILGAAFFVRDHIVILLSVLSIPTSHYVPGLFLSIVLTLCSLIVFDFAVFIEHYLSHKVLFLWEFHKIHHIAEDLNPLTAYRSHPVNQSCFILMVSLFSGTYSGVIRYFFDASHVYIMFAGQNVFMFILLVLGLNLQHSRVFIRYPVWLSKILVSPAYHQLHHSCSKKHYDINFGFIFSFWDSLFSTQVIPSREENLRFGVSGEKYETYASLKKTYFIPFIKSGARISRKITNYVK
jgi:sterol desaturase/sphingolipid hydroxylase (fatty acid hydroxylase superfamily)